MELRNAGMYGLYGLGIVIGIAANSTPKGSGNATQQPYQTHPQQAKQVTQPGVITVTGASLELEITIRSEIATLPKPLQEALSIGPINVVPELGKITKNGKHAAATARSDGTTTIYENGAKFFPGLLPHEAAHHLAVKLWGTPDPPKDYQSYFLLEGGVSAYGKVDPGEDFAEAVRLYTVGGLQAISPRKHAYIAALIGSKQADADSRMPVLHP